MRRRYLWLLLVPLAGCANDPIVDMRGVDPARLDQDLAECRAYAAQVNTPAEAAKHGGIGAAVGGAIGAIIGDSGTAGKGAGIGAVSGATKGAGRAEQRKERVVRNCLKGRGYKVLG